MNSVNRLVKQPLLAGLVVAALAIALSACGGPEATTSPVTLEDSTVSSSAPVDTKTPTAATSAGSSAASSQARPGETAALRVAGTTGAQSVADSTVVSVDRQISTWRVDVVTPDGIEHEMDVTLNGKRLIGDPRPQPEDADDIAEHQQTVQAARLDHLAAIRAATVDFPGSQVVEVELGSEDGRVEWDVRIVDDQQLTRTITVDAIAGDVVQNELDD